MLGDDVLSSNKQPPAKYQQALMLSGGGHQYATLLGRYDALLDMGHKPDLLIASCGGSIVAHLIASIKDPQKRLDWISSKDMHRFWASQQAGPGNQIHRILFSALKRKLWNRVSARLPDLMNTWLFRFDQSFPTLPQPLPDAPDVLMMGTQLNYQEEQIGSNSHDAIFSEVLFCNERVAALLANEASTMAKYTKKISTELIFLNDVSYAQAMRISVADCYYYQPEVLKGKTYIGGLSNLFPIELAKKCSDDVIAERKEDFDTIFASPVIQSIFGFDAQQRLDDFHAHECVTWLPVLHDKPMASIKKKINWWRNELGLVISDYEDFKQQVRSQYMAGYNTAYKAVHKG